MIRTEEITENRLNVYFNRVHLGEFIRDNDGFFYYVDTVKDGGMWSSNSLKMIANKLDEINKPHEDLLNLFFEMSKK
jgi:uncharacterized protein (DUF2164 family)